MSCSIFFLPSSTTVAPESKVIDALLIHFTQRFTCVSLPRWSLLHRLFREVPISSSSQNDVNAKSQATSYLQVLTLSYQPEKAHVAIAATSQSLSQPQASPLPSSGGSAGAGNLEPATIISIPRAATEEFVGLIRVRFGPLWTPRQVINVTDGHTLEIGAFRIRLGEVKQAQQQQTQPVSKGVVMEIEYTGGEQEEKDDWDIAEGLIRAFWGDLGIKGAKEFFRAAQEDDGFGNIRQWCEALRLR